MQEEVEQRIVSLMISCGKLGEQEFRKAIAKLLEQLKNDRQKHQYSKANPHGKMTVKQLAAKDKGLQSIMTGLNTAFHSLVPSFHPIDLCVGVAAAIAIRLAVYIKGKNAKKFRKNLEYGSARCGA